ncbi:transmembrane protein 177 [Colossoma macropomum]|uniref:transmembrane protein 177 n=1 Tax=Colossoma macropomum TaxID=42526 RepID=UPI001864A474|nr:transmembrane protein 177 [Colossoma macropomum]XP_036427491.1 transmembrane protein 177 [Colossoma macropomum]XP_036427500.1 transmembrane protein 177 [Colossoma macropomum]XP_036427510.1 transmembrane protein 177 [Colossoma macropomum]
MASGFLKFSVLVQKYRTPLLLTGCGGVFAANIFYHVFPENTYRKLYQAWSKGEPAVLSDKLEDVFQQVLKDSSVGSPSKYSAFAAYGFHPVGAGVPWLPLGAQIGIPANFNSTADDPSGITNRTILINGKEVEWDSEVGTALKDALLLSRDAQKFAVAREVTRLDGGGPLLQAAVAPACLAGACIYSVALKQIFGLLAGSLILRAGVNVVAVSLGAVSYFLASDAVSQWLEYHSDKRAASLSRDYAKGGVEFYEKILSRNKILRVLMGPKGEEMYAPSGNLFPANVLSLKHAPYTSRRDGILSLLKEEKA